MRMDAWWRWRRIAEEAEKSMFAFFERHPETKPDGSFSHNLVIRAYEAGYRAGKKESNGKG